MRYPKISVITPTLNQSQFIQKTIESVLSQNYPNLEYIVMDGGSTDSTQNILKKYEGQLDWVSEPDKGQADAINKGLQKATGEVFSFINSDDYFFPGVFFEIADFFLSHPETMWITGSYKIVDTHDQSIQHLIVQYKNLLRNMSSPSLLRLANYIIQPSTFWRRSVHETVGYFDENLRYAFDYDFWMRMINHYRPYCTNKPMTAFRIHDESKGGKEFYAQFDEELNVLGKFDTNRKDLSLHRFHNKLIVGLYRIIK